MVNRLISLVLVLVLCLFAVPNFAVAQGAAPEKVYTIKLGYTPGSMPATESPDIMYAEVFKEYVEANSNGAIKVDLYPSGQLGSAAESIQGVVAGTIEMTIVDVALLNNIYAQAQLLACPGMFSTVEEFDAVVSGEWGEQFKAGMEAATGIHTLDIHCKGFRNFTTSNKELKVAADAQGVTFRVQESPVSIKMVEALGGKAVPMPGSEMYVAMQNGVVDGQENPVLNIIQDKTYEVQKYCVLDGHMAGSMAYIINGRFYGEMGADLQKVLEDGSAAAMAEAKKVVETRNREGVQILRDNGMTVYEPTEAELAQWHQIVFEPCQQYLREDLGEESVSNLISAIEAIRQ